MDVESITRFLGDNMLYMDLMVLFSGIITLRAFDKRLRLLFIHIIIGIFVFLASKYTSNQGNNLYISYLFGPHEAVIFSAILFPVQKHKNLRLVITFIVTAIIITNLLEGLLIEDGFTKYNSYTYVMINLLIGSLALRQLLQLRFNPKVENLATSPMFWVATSLAIKHFAVLIIWAFFRVAQESSTELLWLFTLIRELVIYLSLTLWIIAFYVAHKTLHKA